MTLPSINGSPYGTSTGLHLHTKADMVVSDSKHPFADLFDPPSSLPAAITASDMAKLLEPIVHALITSEVTKELFTRRIDPSTFMHPEDATAAPLPYRGITMLPPAYMPRYILWLSNKKDGKPWILTDILDGLSVIELTSDDLARFLARKGMNLTETFMTMTSTLCLAMIQRTNEYKERIETLEEFEGSVRTIANTVRFVTTRPRLMAAVQQDT